MDEQKKIVFLIEDDVEMIYLIHLIFRKHKIEILSKNTGEESLAALQSVKPDLVILDLMLPGMDGWSVYQQLKRSRELKDVPIIVLSARPKALAKVYGQLFEEAVKYVTKPFSPHMLIPLVERSLAYEHSHVKESPR